MIVTEGVALIELLMLRGFGLEMGFWAEGTAADMVGAKVGMTVRKKRIW